MIQFSRFSCLFLVWPSVACLFMTMFSHCGFCWLIVILHNLEFYDTDKGQGLLASEMPSSSLGTVEGIPVMSYAVQTHGMPPNSYHNTAPYPSSAVVGYQQGAGSVYHSQAPGAVAVPYYAPANTNGASYVQPQAPYTSAFAPRPRGQRRGNFLLALLSGAIGGLLLGDIIGGGFWGEAQVKFHAWSTGSSSFAFCNTNTRSLLLFSPALPQGLVP